MKPPYRHTKLACIVRRCFLLFVGVVLATAMFACTRDLPDLGPTYAPLQTATPTVAAVTSSPVPIEGASIEAVFSYVASAAGGRPLRPLFDHLPKDREPIASLASALEAAVPIAPDDRLHANDRGRYLGVSYDDGPTGLSGKSFDACPSPKMTLGIPQPDGARASGSARTILGG